MLKIRLKTGGAVAAAPKENKKKRRRSSNEVCVRMCAEAGAAKEATNSSHTTTNKEAATAGTAVESEALASDSGPAVSTCEAPRHGRQEEAAKKQSAEASAKCGRSHAVSAVVLMAPNKTQYSREGAKRLWGAGS